LPGPGQPSPPEPTSPGIVIVFGISITFSALCTLEGATLNRLDGALARIHCFLRLQRALGWTIRDLDRVLTAVGDNAIDGLFLVRLMYVKQLLDKFGLPLDELLSWWANIETTVYPQDEEQRSLYERLFLSNAVLNPVDDAFVLDERQTELATIGLMSEHIPTIVAALEISAEEVDLIMAAQVTDDTLNLANLSQLYRTVSLAGALDLSITEFLSVSALIGIDPFDRSQINQTLRFVERVEQIRASASSIAELDYLLRHVYDPAAGIGLSHEAIRAALETLRAGLTQIAQEHAPVADPTGAITASKLALLLPAKALPEAMTLLARTSKRGLDGQIRFIETYFEPFLDPAEAVALLVPSPASPPVLSEPEARYGYVLGGALSYLGQAASQALVIQQISVDFELELAVAKALLTKHLPDSLTSLRALVGAADPAVQEAAYQAYLLLHKIALALTKLGAGLADLPWLFNPKDNTGQEYAFGWYDLSQLPLTAQDALNEDTYRSWARLVSVFAFRDKFPTGKRSLFDVLATGHSSASANPVWDAIVAYTGWARDDIRTLAGPDVFGFVSEHYKDERYLLRLDRAFAVLDLIGMPAEVVVTWMPTDDTDAMQVTAQSIKQAVKGKYDDATYLTIAPPLRDAVREKQRAALVTYLVATMSEIDRPSDLFEHFLIDGEMDTCMETSRIKQAISSVQLFVQRCLMGLEPGGKLPAEAAARWEWMKQYRLWEAARKIFLYPENWIEPDLRDDMTPFFEDLSSELRQSALTDESAETALRNYLARLDLIDRIEVRSLYHQLQTADDGTPIDRLHVLARTQNRPYAYYYRQRVDDAYWTAWEPVGVSVAGNHEFLVVHQGTLYLFMPTLDLDEIEHELTVEYQWTVELNWSKYQQGQWVAPQKSAERLMFEAPRTENENYFYFKTVQDGDDLLIIPLWHEDGGGLSFTGDDYLAFRMHCGEKVTIDEGPYTYTIEVPPDTVLDAMTLIEADTEVEADTEGAPLALYWTDAGLGEAGAPDQDVVTVLANTPGLFQIVLPPQYDYYNGQDAFFYHGITRVFYVRPTWELPIVEKDPVASGAQGRVGAARTSITRSSTKASFRLEELLFDLQKKLKFDTFHHPYLCDFLRRLDQGGVPALLQRATQSQAKDYFGDLFDPNTDVVSTAYPIDEVELTYGGAYSIYNEELFFHAPLLIAERLRQNQRFEEAQRWYHFIFNPLAGADGGATGPERYWIYYPFYLETAGQTTLEMMLDLAEGDDTIAKQVEQWRKDPFNTHALARLRPQAYQKSVLMKYIQNLIDWGDQLFTEETIETINGATQLYILAANILGPKPELLPATQTAPKTFNALRGDLDAFSNALVEVENYIAEPAGATGSDNGQLPTLTLYFCIPPNENLLALWDTVAARLFKIRHCMNIEGLVRQLPLFEPPIDPGLLVQAVAMGVDLSSVLSGLYTPLPPYRFQVMLQKALEFCNEVRSLGAALLSALEKKDAEAMSLLRAGHEIQLLAAIRQIKELQIEEADAAKQALEQTQALVEARQAYYFGLITADWNEYETNQQDRLAEANIAGMVSEFFNIGAAAVYVAAGVVKGYTLQPADVLDMAGKANQASAQVSDAVASYLNYRATLNAILGNHERRKEEWGFQVEAATKELEQVAKQLVAADIRRDIMQRELENHDMQIANAQAASDLMQSKFTNEALYDWMISQVSEIYFGSYNMAYDLAKRAEKAYFHEISLTDESSFIQFGYWDSLKKGLMAGEKLAYDLRRMELAHLEQNKREYEITKHISLTTLDPIVLVMLKQSGECYFNLPEAIFDMDYPNHYMRRIKSLSLTIPCVTGPYTGVSCTLTLISNRIRQETGVNGGAYAYTGLEDGRFQHNIGGAIQSIATSGAQNDSGLFELNFRDERYLPFEGSGVISEWRLELPKTFRQFDYGTISDAILHVRYTARDGGLAFRGTVEVDLTTALNTMVLAEAERRGLDRLFSLRHEFPNEWHRLLHPPGESDVPAVTLPLVAERFPFVFQGRTLTIDTIELLVQVSPEFAGTVTKDTLKLSLAAGTTASGPALPYGAPLNGLLRLMKSPAGAPGEWTLALWQEPGGQQQVAPEAIEEIMLVCHYTVS